MHTKAFWSGQRSVSETQALDPVSGLVRRASHLADQGAKLCGAQVSIDPTENGDCDDDVTQDAAQIVKGVDTNCRRQSS